MSFIVARVAPPSGAQPQASEHPPVPRTVTLACKGWELEQRRSKRGRSGKTSDPAHAAGRIARDKLVPFS
jgi:hypothetical protein